MEPVMARKMWRTLEPYHGLIYFAPEATAAYEALGVMGFDGYFASRAAPMGAVPAEVVVATFFNFNPAIVHHAIPAAWNATTPEALLAARFDAAGQALRRAAGDLLDDPSVPRAAELARTAAEACTAAGRPLYAGHAVAALARRSGARALARHHAAARVPRRRPHRLPRGGRASTGSTRCVFHAASGEVPRAALQGSRQWDDAAWDASVASLGERGLRRRATAPSPRPAPPSASRSRTAPTPSPWRPWAGARGGGLRRAP